MSDAPKPRKVSSSRTADGAKEKKPSASSSKSKSSSSKPTSADNNAAPADGTAQTHHLTLRSSSRLVTEFFEYSIHTVLFQRGVYPAEDFSPVKKYGLTMLVSSDDQVRAYVKKMMSQVSKWMGAPGGGKVKKLVLVIVEKDGGSDVERWSFDVDILSSTSGRKDKSARTETTAASEENSAAAAAASQEEPQPTEAEIQQQIQAIFRQITASVTFLPTLSTACTFNVLVYADADSEVPLEWGDSEAREIEGGERVQLRSFGTGYHKVGAVVSYRVGE